MITPVYVPGAGQTGYWNAVEDSGSAPARRAEAEPLLRQQRLDAGRSKPDTPLAPQQCAPWPRTITAYDRALLGEWEYQRLLREGQNVAG